MAGMGANTGPSSVVERSCTMLVHFDKASAASDIKEALESGDNEAKVLALKKAIMCLLNGETLPQLFITVVRYVLPSDDHTVQKLLLLYLEIIEKTDANGKVLPEMILICQNLRNNLQHPNEYIRGCTLRFLCRITEAELLEPLVPSVLANLEHRHSFVRRNAVLAVEAIYRLPNGDMMLGDAAEIVEKFLSTESDLSARRNAFKMLCAHFQDRAVEYLMSKLDQMSNWGDILQMQVLELIRKMCRVAPESKGKYIKIILTLLQSQSAGVVYECAGTLISLSSAPTAVRAAANCYTQLLISQSDNNVKLIVLDRLQDLKEKHRDVMQDSLMDVLRAMASPSMDVRAKTLELALDLVTGKNIDEAVTLLKREVVKTHAAATAAAATETTSADKAMLEYRSMLVSAIHKCAVKFPDVAESVVYIMMDFLSTDTNSIPAIIAAVTGGTGSTASAASAALGGAGSPLASIVGLGSSTAAVAAAADVAYFIREIAQTNAKLRSGIVKRLLDSMDTIRAGRVVSTVLWIIGEYAESKDEVGSAIAKLREGLGLLPLSAPASAGSMAVTAGTPGAATALYDTRGGALLQSLEHYSASVSADADAAASTASANGSSPAPSQTASAGASTKPVVLADGTYASQAAVSEGPDASSLSANAGGVVLPGGVIAPAWAHPNCPHLRALLLSGDFYTGAIVCATWTKLLFKLVKLNGAARSLSDEEMRRVLGMSLLYFAAILRLGESAACSSPMDDDSRSRIGACVRAVSLLMGSKGSDDVSNLEAVWVDECRASYAQMVDEKRARAKEESDKETLKQTMCQPDDVIELSTHLKFNQAKGMSQIEYEDLAQQDISKATGYDAESQRRLDDTRLKRVLQLTGFSDPVYAEAYVTVHQYDIVLDVTVLNRTAHTMQNLNLELATMGDLKLVERPQNHTLAPRTSKHIRANIKVSSTETGVIFGNIVYETTAPGAATTGGDGRNVVVLNDIHIDIMDYIHPASCADAAFRNMWAEFEWENKVAVNTSMTDVRQYLNHIVKSTNMRCLTPHLALEGECGFLAANLYAKSVFGEDALVNVSVERSPTDGKLSGYIRIRSKTQGIALSLGDKITLKQRGSDTPSESGTAGAPAPAGSDSAPVVATAAAATTPANDEAEE
ncbi:coatomer subunit beta [Pseudoscourfieldia marina]